MIPYRIGLAARREGEGKGVGRATSCRNRSYQKHTLSDLAKRIPENYLTRPRWRHNIKESMIGFDLAENGGETKTLLLLFSRRFSVYPPKIK